MEEYPQGEALSHLIKLFLNSLNGHYYVLGGKSLSVIFKDIE